MKRGLIAHSTETVATTAVTIAGIAATRENSATNRLCRRAPARAAFLAALRRASSMRDEDDQRDDDEAVADQQDGDDGGRRQDRSEAGEDEERRQREHECRSDGDRTESPRWPAIVEGAAPPAAALVVVPVKFPNPQAAPHRGMPHAWQSCNNVARLRLFGGACQRKLGIPRRLRSRIFLRSVLRLRPRISAALIWLPRVRASVAAISGASRSRRTRW